MLRMVLHALIFLLALTPALLSAQTQSAATRAATTSQKMLIEFGWDEPDTAFLRKHIATMETMPFDGTVFHVTYDKPAGGKGSFMNECWSSHRFTAAELKSAREDLKNTPLKAFTHNFLRFNVCPGDVDWFDDAGFAAVVANARLAAELARDGRAAGILFDSEEYNTPLFDYRKQKHRDTKSFEQYAKQTRQRGRELMRAFQDGYPDVTVMLTFAYTLPYSAVAADRAKLAQVDYGLLVPLLDGMFDVAGGKAKIVDGFEMSYAYKQAAEFDGAAKTMREKVVPLVAEPQKYRQHLSIGFGLWMDYDWRKKGWDPGDVSKNYFTPEQFGASVRKALDACDEYVWVYTEEPKWWAGSEAKPDKLPAAYVEAVRKAREGK